MRLDQYLVINRLAKSRAFAAELIARGLIEVNGCCVRKAAYDVKDSDSIEITGDFHDYVARSALKLVAALQAFSIDLKDKTVLDIGSSTGGFTEVCLRAQAKLVIAVDVGSNQLAAKLKGDPRILLKENCDIRTISKGEIPHPDFICCDVSFISLRLVLPKISELADLSCAIICLFKPQFELGQKSLNKQGLVKDPQETKQALTELEAFLPGLDMTVKGMISCPLPGKSGNQEYLLYLKKTRPAKDKSGERSKQK